MNNQTKTTTGRIITRIIFLIILTLAVCTLSINAQSDSLHKTYSDTVNYTKMRDSLMKVYSKQQKEYEKMTKQDESKQRGLGSSFFGLNLDVIFGVGISNTQFDVNGDTTGLSNANSKTGPMLGVNVNFNLLGIALGTGFNYSSKGFSTGSSQQGSANYINIPLMFAFNFDLGKKVEVDLAAGPYVGILLSQEKNQYYQLSNIDLGIVATVQGNYFFNRFFGALLGVKYEHGGLNNLIEQNNTTSNYVSSVKARNWFIYSGIKFVL
ncbi:MAG: outer membrane beta-barrel protein [Ignavibacteria bacterium]